MATSPQLQGQGVGGSVLLAAVDHVRDASGLLMWCNARTPAQAFYERAGFAAVGDRWQLADIGPHIRMWLAIDNP